MWVEYECIDSSGRVVRITIFIPDGSENPSDAPSGIDIPLPSTKELGEAVGLTGVAAVGVGAILELGVLAF